jgi:hypothetical protein
MILVYITLHEQLKCGSVASLTKSQRSRVWRQSVRFSFPPKSNWESHRPARRSSFPVGPGLDLDPSMHGTARSTMPMHLPPCRARAHVLSLSPLSEGSAHWTWPAGIAWRAAPLPLYLCDLLAPRPPPGHCIGRTPACLPGGPTYAITI